jgi:predicted DNA-binding antitoxin AbrB/MazE fold protein
MSLEIDATYENGVLKPDLPLPLKDRQRVKVTVREETSRVQRSYGMIGWTGDPEILRKIADDDELSGLESP